MSNQTSSTDSTFKMPAPPVYSSQSEALLFQDIIEEKTVALRSILNDFLKVHPYRKFDIEFNMFLKRVKRIIIDGHRTGSNISRITNSSDIAPLFAPPSTNFNDRPPTNMTMVSSSDHSMLRLPVNNFYSVEPSKLSNPFEPADCLQPKVVLSHIEQSSCVSNELPSTSSTVIKVSQNHNVTVERNDNHEIAQQSKSVSKNQPTALNTYSDVTFEENKSVSESHKNENINDDNNSIESLLEGVGFKIAVGLPENKNEISKKSNTSQHHNNQLNVLENVGKFLSMWSLNMKLIKSSQQSSISKYVLILTGNLLGEDKKTVVEKHHEAGILEGRKEDNLVKTKNGLYHLVGNIIGGSPNELYQTCVSINGIPRTWRKIVKQLTGVDSKPKHMFDFLISSPAELFAKSIKAAVNLDASMNRKGTTCSKNMTLANHKTNIKRKLSEYGETLSEHNKIKHRRFCEHMPLLLASTPKKPKRQPTTFETPSQMLRKMISQNLSNNPNKRQKLDSFNDTNHINKKSQSQLKEQTNIILEPKTPEKTSISNINSTILINQTPVNKSKILNSYNSSAAKSKNNMLENSCVTKNPTKQQSKMKTTINSTNSSVDKSRLKTSLLSKSKENIKTIKQTTPQVPKKKTSTNHVSIVKPSAISESPAPLSNSIEVKALTRVKAPKITLEDEMKYKKKRNTKQYIDFKTVSNKINKMLEFGNDEDEED